MPQNTVMDKSVKKTAVVVGGSSGIGYETCVKLSGRGWNVINVSRTPCKNPKISSVAADAAAGSALPDAINKIAEKNEISALIYSAGFSMAAPVEYAKESDYRYLFDVNFFGALKSVQAAIPHMKQRGGRIVLIGSLGGEVPIVFDSFYSASKSALEMFARSAYSELKPYNIKVTAVLPGGTATGFTYKRKIYPAEENLAYSGGVNRAAASLANMEQGGMHPTDVAEIIYGVLIADKPPVIKVCGAKNAALRLLTRIAPEKVTLKVNERIYHQ